MSKKNGKGKNKQEWLMMLDYDCEGELGEAGRRGATPKAKS